MGIVENATKQLIEDNQHMKKYKKKFFKHLKKVEDAFNVEETLAKAGTISPAEEKENFEKQNFSKNKEEERIKKYEKK